MIFQPFYKNFIVDKSTHELVVFINMNDNTAKQCTRCDQVFDLSNFYPLNNKNPKGSKTDPICKDCRKLVNKENYAKHKHKYIIPRKAQSLERKEYLRDYYAKNTEKVRQRCTEYNNKNRERVSQWTKQWRIDNAVEWEAIKELNRAIRHKKVFRPETCECCDLHLPQGEYRKARIEAHHQDYAKPLLVLWLCRSCHRRYHEKDAVAVNKCNEIWLRKINQEDFNE
jgi:hypothetical protein